MWHKPKGVPSATVVREAQAALAAVPGKRWAVCHGGALDPFATGLVTVLIGPVTRLFEPLHALPKRYRATVVWGRETDTGDAGGAVVAQGGVPERAAVEAALSRFVGFSEQVPPATSNKRVGGERAYARAHRGEVVTLPPSRVYLHEAVVVAHDGGESLLDVVVRGGFYVRSLARDLGRALGCPAHLRELERVAIGPWVAPPPGPAVHLPVEQTFPFWRRVDVDDAQWGELKAERAIAWPARVVPASWRAPPGWPEPLDQVQLWHQQRLVGVGPAGERLALQWWLAGVGG